YKAMLAPMFMQDFGPDAAQAVEMGPYDQIAGQIRQMATNFNSDQARAYNENNPKFEGQVKTLNTAVALFDYLEVADAQNEEMNPMMVQPQ
ncbi:MAG: hypothetical protein K2I08_12095, partial [Muribaculaceae bacterium]|nr:hypothetical protein [Muribaculaceae bacterium]